MFSSLGPNVVTLREERAFRLHYVDPTGPEWGFRRSFRNEVLIGSSEHPWMAKALEKLPDSVSVTVPGTYEAEDVWARGQRVTIIVVNPAEAVGAQLNGLLDTVYQRIAERFKEGVRYRLYLTGPDTILADSFKEMAGFSLLVPKVYQRGAQDSLYWFRNDKPSSGELIRQLAVTWRTPVPDALSVDSLVSWKEDLSRAYYNYPQVVDRESLQSRSRILKSMPVEELQGAW